MIKIFSNTKSKIELSSGTFWKNFYRVIYFRCVPFSEYNVRENQFVLVYHLTWFQKH